MCRFLFSLLLIPCLFTTPASTQDTSKEKGLQAITIEVLQAQLDFLASDWMQGRETGTKGAYMAADHIAGLFRTIGLEPAGDRDYRVQLTGSRALSAGNFGNRTYFQNFNLLQVQPGSIQKCRLARYQAGGYLATDLEYLVDYALTPGTESFEVEAPLVFVGYGLPGGKYGFNDYKNTDVKGKIIIRLTGYPGWKDPGSKGFKRFSPASSGRSSNLDRIKDSAALARGAIAVVELNPGSSDNFQIPANLPFRYNQDYYEGEEPFRTGPRTRLILPDKLNAAALPKLTLSRRVINTILDVQGIDPEGYEKDAAINKAGRSVEIAGMGLHIVSTVETCWIRARNVIGMIEGEDTESCIVIGAHYDHVGMTRGFIYNGSDDNASGTVGMMTIARAMIAAGVKPKVTLIFCAWTAEEKGLLGSAWYAGHPLIENIRCYMNYDMISRTAPDDPTGMKCDFNYSSGMPVLREMTEKHIKDYDIRLDMAYQSSPVPVGGSDFSSFSRKGVPIFLIHGKFTPDYHHFTDHSEKAVWPYFQDIVKLGYLNIYELAKKNW